MKYLIVVFILSMFLWAIFVTINLFQINRALELQGENNSLQGEFNHGVNKLFKQLIKDL